MSLKSWLKNADKELEEVIGSDLHNSDMFKEGKHKKMLLPYYLQYKMISLTWWLVFATWVLVIVTIFLVYFTR